MAKVNCPPLRIAGCASKFDGWLQVLMFSPRSESRNRARRIVFHG